MPSTLGYIGEFELIDDHRSGKIVVQLNGRLNKTGVISPRFNVQVTQIESWVNLLLPARGFGIIILVRTLLIVLPRTIFVDFLCEFKNRPLPLVSSITRRPVGRTLVASSLATSTERIGLWL